MITGSSCGVHGLWHATVILNRKKPAHAHLDGWYTRVEDNATKLEKHCVGVFILI